MRVVVIGAGIVGASVAFRLVESRVSVELIDATVPGKGTSARSFAWLNANQKEPREYFDLNLAGMAEHRRLAAELAPAPWHHPDGNIAWADEAGAADLQNRVQRLRSWGYKAEVEDLSALAAREPILATGPKKALVASFLDEGWLDAQGLVSRLVQEIPRRNGTVRTATPVTEIVVGGGRVSGVVTLAGERIPADVVVNAAGPDADRVASLVGSPLPLEPIAGLLLRLEDLDNPLRSVVHGPRTNARPDGDGYFILQCAELDDRLGDRRSIHLDDPLVQDVLELGRSEFPALVSSRLVEARIGVRPMPVDTFPSIGAVSGISGYFEAVTHSGVTLGAVIGRFLTERITTGSTDPLVAAYSPDRLR